MRVAFGPGRTLAAVRRLRGGSKKGVYRLSLDDGRTVIGYIWAPWPSTRPRSPWSRTCAAEPWSSGWNAATPAPSRPCPALPTRCGRCTAAAAVTLAGSLWPAAASRRRLRFGEHYRSLREDGLDEERLRFYRLAMHLSLIAGPLRLLDGDFPDREPMRRIVEYNIDKALEFVR